MTERNAPDPGAIACPFLALEDERDERNSVPDHRHRCYAEVQPAPRAIAHQVTFCLSSAFAACPTFQDWARREAAKPRPSATAPAAPSPRTVGQGLARAGQGPVDGPPVWQPAPDEEPDMEEAGLAAWTGANAVPGMVAGPGAGPGALAGSNVHSGRPDFSPPDFGQPVRNPQRDWAAPPPWVDPASRESAGPEADEYDWRTRPIADEALRESGGLAGSRWVQDESPTGMAPGIRDDGSSDDLERSLADERAARRRALLPPAVSATADLRPDLRPELRQGPPADFGQGVPADFRQGPSGPTGARGRAPAPRPASGRFGGPPPEEHQLTGPAWERPRPHEAYPTLKTRIGLPSVPRIGVAVGVLIVAALAVFLVPFLLKSGGTGGVAGASPTPTAIAPSSTEPTPTSLPTAQVYTVVQGDTMSTIAKKFGLTINQVMAANKQIKNPNKIAIGDQITIPIAPPSVVVNGASPGAIVNGASPGASAAP